MRIEDCKTDFDAVAAAPFTRTGPEGDWVEAKNAEILPLAAFQLYSRANFLSFGTAPRFLKDDKNHLFSYFSLMLRSVKGTLVEANQELQGFIEAQSQTYDPGKKARHEPWDTNAEDRVKKHFRMLVLSLCASLDVVSELTAILLTNQIPGLKVGRAEFNKIEDWLKKPVPMKSGLISPQEAKAEALYQKLKPIVEAAGPEKDWLPLLKLFRHKAAHLGTEYFRGFGLHDERFCFYVFYPRNWPILWVEHVQPSSRFNQSKPDMARVLAQLMKVDAVSYARGLRAKVTGLVSAALDILYTAYLEFETFQPDQEALSQLQSNFQTFSFEAFLESE